MARKINDYEKWIWQYKRRIIDYQARKDLNAIKKRGMIENAKYRIKVYSQAIRLAKKTAKLKLASIKKIKEKSELILLKRITIKAGLPKKLNVEDLFVFKFLLENDFKALDVAKEYNCTRYTPPRRRSRLNNIIMANKDVKVAYVSYAKQLKESIK